MWENKRREERKGLGASRVEWRNVVGGGGGGGGQDGDKVGWVL